MHQIIGTGAGVLAVPAWTTAVLAVVVNHSQAEPVFGPGLIVLLVAAGSMLSAAWFAHVTVRASVRERQALYLQGVRDALSIEEVGSRQAPTVTSLTQRASRQMG